ncbi:haloacid dehalogenase [Bifidobacterium dolichotidis]|uniref:Haloacid dehalogenase n=1 Tax=Bifidobacterium dolichotidis TaxID=2306976 RepID=A0A430FT20_9BIFI|nr:HAD-IIB family hydrolase [Bifidobacterium dolichotidis]RSX56023.1 haloacid dehalogenase [Bifidobacterium dolichotidis]
MHQHVLDPTQMVVADLDGTLLHDAATFEQRDLSLMSELVINELHRQHIPFAIATARPVSTAMRFVERLQPDACVYLNGALIDFDPAHSTTDMLNQQADALPDTAKLIGFPSDEAAKLCLQMLDVFPDLEIGIVMNDVRYTSFDLTKYWTDQDWQYTDFTDIPQGTAAKIIIFPKPDQWEPLQAMIPDDMDVHISEGILLMITHRDASKEHALKLVANHFSLKESRMVTFGDDLIDINMMRDSGRGIAVANAVPQVLRIADEICAPNNEDGVAQWIHGHLL